MTDRTVETSPQLYARIGGALYLTIIVLGIVAEAFVRDRLIVSDDAAATAANIASMESLWRFGIVSEFLMRLCATALAMIYFVLLRPISKELHLLATFLRLVSIAVQAARCVVRLGRAIYMEAGDKVMVEALRLALSRLDSQHVHP